MSEDSDSSDDAAPVCLPHLLVAGNVSDDDSEESDAGTLLQEGPTSAEGPARTCTGNVSTDGGVFGNSSVDGHAEGVSNTDTAPSLLPSADDWGRRQARRTERD